MYTTFPKHRKALGDNCLEVIGPARKNVLIVKLDLPEVVQHHPGGASVHNIPKTQESLGDNCLEVIGPARKKCPESKI